MTWMDRRLLPALACSLLLHALPFAPGLLKAPKSNRAMPPPLEAHLLPPPAPQATPPLMLPEPTRPSKAQPPAQPPAPAKAPKTSQAPAKGSWMSEASRQIKEMDRQGQFYPAEAKARGLQGESLVLFIVDESGNVVAARIEQSSGHTILDDAALRAVRRLHSLPAEAPREAQMSIRFRLQ